ncbi:MAG: hypothetical protein U5N86_01475 [Planctomycetota bacterium]|nr:hypothetical protein [Planctomycetota bacterium]
MRIKDLSELIQTGNECLKSGYYEESIAILKLVLEKDYWSPDVVTNLVEAYLAIGDRDEAVARLRELVEHYRREGELDMAIERCANIVEVLPEDANEHVALATLYLEAGKKNRAVEEFRLAQKKINQKEDPDTYIRVSEEIS